MKAMILAAGRGERMRPLTDDCPKPLLRIGAYSLIEWRLLALAAAGIREIVVNLAYRGEQIRAALGDGAGFGVRIAYSEEAPAALETAGGIIQALPLLGRAPFLVVNADIWTDFPCTSLQLPDDCLASLVLVDNPAQHPKGDFHLDNGRLSNAEAPRLTFAGIGLYRPEFFEGLEPGARALAPLLRAAADQGRLAGTHYRGRWQDIGTPERLAEICRQVESGPA